MPSMFPGQISGDCLYVKPKLDTLWQLPQPGAREKAQGHFRVEAAAFDPQNSQLLVAVAGDLVLWKISNEDGDSVVLAKKPVPCSAPQDHDGALVRQIFYNSSIRGGNFQVFIIPSQLSVYDQKLGLIGTHSLHERHFLCAALHNLRSEMCMAFADGTMKMVSCISSHAWEGIGLGTRHRLHKDNFTLVKEWKVEKPRLRQISRADSDQHGAWGGWVSSLFTDEQWDRCLGCCGLDIMIWRWQNGDLLRTLARLHEQPITACWLTSEMHLITSSRDNLVKVWHYCSGFEHTHPFRPVSSNSDSLSPLLRRACKLHRRPVQSNLTLTTATAMGSMTRASSLTASSSDTPIGTSSPFSFTASPHPRLPTAAASPLLSPNEPRVAAVVMPYSPPRLLETLQAHERGVFGLAVDPDTECLFTSGDDGVVYCWNARRFCKVSSYVIGPPAPSFLSLALDSSGRRSSLFVDARMRGNIASGTVQLVTVRADSGPCPGPVGNRRLLVAIHGTDVHVVRVRAEQLAFAEALGPVERLFLETPGPVGPGSTEPPDVTGPATVMGAEDGMAMRVTVEKGPGPGPGLLAMAILQVIADYIHCSVALAE